jgi:Tol biopolymer transport system component
MKTLTFLILLGGTPLAQTTERASIGTQPNAACGAYYGMFHQLTRAPSGEGPISADGRFVAFVSGATNLVPSGTNGAMHIFVRDLQTGAIELVSVATGGAQAGADSDSPSISADGRFVAFNSFASNLVSGDTNGVADVFVRDRLNGTTERVSVGPGGVEGNGACDYTTNLPGYTDPTGISGDGRYVVFTSLASNLVTNDHNGHPDVFVRDRLNGTTELVSVSTSGDSGFSYNVWPSMSADGRYVAFTSDSTNLVPGGTVHQDVFVRDRQTGTTVLASVSTGGVEQNNLCQFNSISADGRYVAFESNATNLTSPVPNAPEVYLRDLVNGTTTCVSAAPDGTPGDMGAAQPAISSNGRYVAFESSSTNLVAGDANNTGDIFLRDLVLGTTEVVSLTSSGGQANNASIHAAISADGRYVTFGSYASNFAAGGWSGDYDLFVRDRQSGTTSRVDQTSYQGNSFSDEVSVSADGRCVAFRSNASNIGPLDHNSFYDVFVYDRPSASVEQVSVPAIATVPNGPSHNPSISSDGRYVAFESEATNMVSGDTNNSRDIFLRDRQTFTTTRVSLSSSGAESDSNCFEPSISADGRFVAFFSPATNLVAGDTNGLADIFVRDRLNSTTERVSVATGGAQSNSYSVSPAISADGRYVAFTSAASNLVAGDTNFQNDVFVHDRQTGTTERVSVATSGAEANNESNSPSISADGRYVAFLSYAGNLVAGDTNGAADVFVRDRQNGTTERVSVSSSGAQGDIFMASYNPSISADGRYVAFNSEATNLVAGDTNGATDMFVHDRLTGITERVSLATDGTQANASSVYPPSISSDGRLVAFPSDASNLVANDTNGYSDIFVRDRGASSAFSSFCFGDGTGAPCPCANNGNAGHGCQNSAGTGGAVLAGAGAASLSNDTVVLTSSSELPTAISVVLQGNSVVSYAVFGDGLRCAGGSLKRLYTKHAVGGVMTAPQTGDPTISARSAALGDTIPLGATRIYQVYYRDANLTFCPGGFNTTNAIAIAWGA